MASPIPRTRRLSTRFYAVALLFGLVLVMIRVGVLVATNQLRDASRLSEHSQQVLAAADAVQRRALDLETGLRGWQLTGDRSFLDPTNRALADLPRLVRQLEGLVRDEGAQASRARALGRQIDDYVRNYIRPALQMPGELTRAEAIATTREGKRRLDAVRARFDAFIGAESRIASGRSADARASSARAELAGVFGLVVVLLLLAAAVVYLARVVIDPVADVADAAARIAGGDLGARVPARGAGEVAQLGASFNAMATSLEANREELRRGAADLGRANAELDAKNMELGRAYADLERSKDQAILELTTPALEINDRTLLLPLIGELGSERAKQVKQRLLDAVRERRARFVVLDVTGVPALDTEVARMLVETVESARLLGARVLLTGVSGEIAASLVHLGVESSQLQTRADLRAGVAWATGPR
jgi:anti-anti-sigma regulatory factor/CHASE3 domain sensor protein